MSDPITVAPLVVALGVTWLGMVWIAGAAFSGAYPEHGSKQRAARWFLACVCFGPLGGVWWLVSSFVKLVIEAWKCMRQGDK